MADVSMFFPVQAFGIFSNWQATHSQGTIGTWQYTDPSTGHKTVTFQTGNIPKGVTIKSATLSYRFIVSTTGGTVKCKGTPSTTSQAINVKTLINNAKDADGTYHDISVEFTYKANGHYPTGNEPSDWYDSTATIQYCTITVVYSGSGSDIYDEEDYMAAAKAPARDIRPRGMVTYADGAVQLIGPEDIVNFEINEGTDDGVLLGQALSAKMELQLANAHGEWLPGGACRPDITEGSTSVTRPLKGATVTLEIGLLVEGKYMYTPAGVFVIEDISGNENEPIIEVDGHDMMTSVMESTKLDDTTQYPATINQILQTIINQSGFGVQGTPAANTAETIEKKPDWGEECTLRQALGFVMAATGSFAYMTRDAKIGIESAWNTGARHISLTPEDYLQKEYNENSFTFNCLSIAPANAKDDSDNVEVFVDSSIEKSNSNTLYLDDNPLMPLEKKDWIRTNIAAGIKMVFAPGNGIPTANWHGMKVEWRGNPSVQIGTRLTLTDTRGVDTETTICFQCMRWTKGFSATAECTIDSDETVKAGALTGAGKINLKLIGEGGVVAYMLGDGSVLADKIADYAVKTDKIAANAVTSGKINANAVTTAKIAADAVTAGKIAANAVEADKIKAGAVTTAKLDASAVTAEKIAANAVEADKIKAGAVTTAKLDASAVTTEKLAAGAVTAAKIAAGTITANEIKANTITAAKMAAGTITADSGIIANSAIGTTQIADGSITDAKIVSLTANKLTAGTIDASVITVNNLTADNITTGTINGQRIPVLGTEKLEDGAVTGAKVAKNAITADKIVAGAVTAGKIAANAVAANNILAGAITAGKLAADSVDTVNLKASSVTVSKLASDVGSSLDISSNTSINLLLDRTNIKPNLLYSDELIAPLSDAYDLGDITLDNTIDAWKQICTLEANKTYTMVFDGIEVPAGRVTDCQIVVRDTDLHSQFVPGVEPTYYIKPNTYQETRIMIRTEAEAGTKKLRIYKGHDLEESRAIDTVTYKNVRIYNGALLSTERFVIAKRAAGYGQVVTIADGLIRTNVQYVLSFGKLANAGVTAAIAPTRALYITVRDTTTGTDIIEQNVNFSDKMTEMPIMIEDTSGTLSTHRFAIRLNCHRNVETEECCATLIEHMKLEEGEHATVWQPASAENEVRMASLQVGIDGIEERVVTAENNINTIVSNEEGIRISVEGGANNYLNDTDFYITSQGTKAYGTDYLTEHWSELRGKTITLSVDIELTNAKADESAEYKRVGIRPWFNFTDGTRLQCNTFESLTSTAKTMKKRLAATFTVPDKALDSVQYASVYIQGLGSGTAKAGHAKLEIGSINTPWTLCPDDPASKLENSSVKVDTSGVKIKTGGKVDIQAGAEFNVNAGKVNIQSLSRTGNKILLGTDGNNPLFQVSEEGEVVAQSGTFDSISVRNLEINGSATGENPIMVLGANVVFADSKPTTGPRPCIWLKPTGGGGATTTKTLSWTNSSGQEMAWNKYDWEHYYPEGTEWAQGSNDTSSDKKITLSGGSIGTGVGNYTYELTISYTGRNYSASGVGVTAYIGSGSSIVTLTGTANFSLGNGTVKITGTSATKLTGSSALIKVVLAKSSSIRDSTTVVLRGLTLKVKYSTGSSDDSTCEVHYLV